MSASPAPEDAEQPKKIAFRFCRECANLLYPKDDPENSTLEFVCRSCNYSEPAASACVYRNEMSNTVGETAGITQDVGQDPTVGLPEFCTCCGNIISCERCGQDSDRGFWLEIDVDGDIPMPACTPTPPMSDPPSPDNVDIYFPSAQHAVRFYMNEQFHPMDGAGYHVDQHMVTTDGDRNLVEDAQHRKYPATAGSQQEEAATHNQ